MVIIDRGRCTCVVTGTTPVVCVVWLMLRWPVWVAHPMACDPAQPSKATHEHNSALGWRCTTEHVMNVYMTCCELVSAYVCIYITWYDNVCVKYYPLRSIMYKNTLCVYIRYIYHYIYKTGVRRPLNQTVVSGLYSKQSRDSWKNNTNYTVVFFIMLR